MKPYKKSRETLAMLRLSAMTNKEDPDAKGIKDTFDELRKEFNPGNSIPSNKK